MLLRSTMLGTSTGTRTAGSTATQKKRVDQSQSLRRADSDERRRRISSPALQIIDAGVATIRPRRTDPGGTLTRYFCVNPDSNPHVGRRRSGPGFGFQPMALQALAFNSKWDEGCSESGRELSIRVARGAGRGTSQSHRRPSAMIHGAESRGFHQGK